MPIHIIRDVALTIRSFYKRITDFVRYRHATRDMNERYPDATAEEIGGEDVCIICREAMRPWQAPRHDDLATNNATPPVGSSRSADERLRPKKLPCGHILHFACLRSWLERQQNCPTCRRPVLATSSNVGASGPQNIIQRGQVNGLANAANNGEQGQRADQQVGGRANRIRVFNIGPIRLGFGAGQDVQGLAEHLNQPPAQQPQNRQHRNQAGDIAQQLGFGLRFGRQPQVATVQQGASHSRTNGVQDQLQVIEQQLMQDINHLRAQADQLNLVRALQGELARLRIAQAHANFSQTGARTPTGVSRSLSANLSTTAFSNLSSPPAIQAFNTVDHQAGLVAGSQELPPGMTLPEGWTLLPLQRVSNHASIVAQFAAAAQNSTSALTSNNSSTVPSGAVAENSNLSIYNSDPIATFPLSNGARAETPDQYPTEAPYMSMPQPEERQSSIKPSSGLRSNSGGISGSKASAVEQEVDHEDDGSTNKVESASALQWKSRNSRGAGGLTVVSSSESQQHSDWGDAPPTPSTDGKVDKGKGRATTVEDAKEEID